MSKPRIRRLCFSLEREAMGFFEKQVTRFGNGAKIDCPKEYLGKRVYVLVCRE